MDINHGLIASKNFKHKKLRELTLEEETIITQIVMKDYFTNDENSPRDISNRTGVLQYTCERIVTRHICIGVDLRKLKAKYLS